MYANHFKIWLKTWRMLICCATLSIALLFGFAKFIDTVHSLSQDETATALGIVVLTGESSRIKTGIELLERKKGQKLLISGVNQNSLPNHLTILKEQKTVLFSCCISLGYTATNTVGNAHEIEEWAKKHSYAKLLVVTSGYHMPRALVELRRVMPNTQFIPYPAKTRLVHDVWNNPEMLKRFVVEYFKFIVAYIRAKIEVILL